VYRDACERYRWSCRPCAWIVRSVIRAKKPPYVSGPTVTGAAAAGIDATRTHNVMRPGRKRHTGIRATGPVLTGFVFLLGVLLAGEVVFANAARARLHALQTRVDGVAAGLDRVEGWRRAMDRWIQEVLHRFATGSEQAAVSARLPTLPAGMGSVPSSEGVGTPSQVQRLLQRLRQEQAALRGLVEQARVEAGTGGQGMGRPPAWSGELLAGLRGVQDTLAALGDAYHRQLLRATDEARTGYRELMVARLLFLAMMLAAGAMVGWLVLRRVEAVQRSYEREIRLRAAIEQELEEHRDRLEDLVNERTIELSYQASHDALTGLFNRYEFERRLEITLSLCRTARCTSSVLYLDLDRFKFINDTCGHMAGDELLRQIADLLQERVRKGDTLARLGGDEFGVILDGCDVTQARVIAQGIKEAVAGYRFAWHGGMYSVGVSIGISVITPDELGCAEVLSRADSACYLAKEEGRNRVRVYTDSDQQVRQRSCEVWWLNRVRAAMQEGRLELFGQPIAPSGIMDGKPLDCEVLLRIRDEAGDKVYLPGDFIPAAERFGMMGELDRWVLEQAMSQYMERFGDAPPARRPTLFVNISAQTVSDLEFARWAAERVRAHGMPAGALCLEITETAAIANLGRATELMTALHREGVLFALDDFGSGLTSFSSLRSMPLQFLKIEGEFVRDMEHDEVATALVRAINEVGHVMGMKTIAEYVENKHLLRLVRGLGVDYFQGYAFARPSPLESAFDLCQRPGSIARMADG